VKRLHKLIWIRRWYWLKYYSRIEMLTFVPIYILHKINTSCQYESWSENDFFHIDERTTEGWRLAVQRRLTIGWIQISEDRRLVVFLIRNKKGSDWWDSNIRRPTIGWICDVTGNDRTLHHRKSWTGPEMKGR
jgi:hypothetical protein